MMGVIVAGESASERASGDWNAGLYDDAFSFVWQHGSNLIDLLAPQPGERVLDLGCGTGHLAQAIAERGAEVVGLDSAPSMVEQARRNYPNLRFEVADAAGFDLGRFDAVFSNAVLHWVPQPQQVIASVRGALKPGGRFVAEFGGHGNVAALTAALLDAIAAAGYPAGAERNPWFFPGIAEYTALLERGGLEPTLALLFDRPTLLDGGEAGLRNWIEMFADSFLAGVPAEGRNAIARDVERRLRPTRFRDGTWVADYRRLRVVAWRRDDGA
jgi:SAM-dependent methyltransferase